MNHLARATAILMFAFFGVGTVAVAARPARAADDPWSRGANWLTVRAGYAKSTVEGAADGGGGYGLAFTHMLERRKIWRWTLFKQFSIGGSVQHDILGKFGSAQEIEVPATLELVRHLDWGSSFHPYLGIGGGMVYRKLYRTGADNREVKPGMYVNFGGNIPISRMQMLGVDARVLRVDATNDPPDPVFGVGSGTLVTTPDGVTSLFERKKGTHVSVKIGYTIAY